MVYFPLYASLEISSLGLYLESTCSLTHPPRPKSTWPNQEVPKGPKRYQKINGFGFAVYILPLWASSAANLYNASGGAGWACKIFIVGKLDMPMKMSNEKP